MPDPFKVIFDTNIWISYLITDSFKSIDGLLREGKIITLLSPRLLEEFIQVSKREKLKAYISDEKRMELSQELMKISLFVFPKSEIDICRDKKDNYLLAMALDGNANFLVTGDKDLLVLKRINDTRILTYTDFMKQIT